MREFAIRIYRMIRKLFSKLFPRSSSPLTTSATQRLEHVLHRLQVEWEVTPTSQGGAEMDYHFHFQNGDFHAMAREGRPYVRVHFLFFLDTAFGNLDNVRYACNEFNTQYPEYKVIYTLDEKEHKINLHIAMSFRLADAQEVDVRDFGSSLTMCFEAARTYRQLLESILESDNSNLEENTAMNRREVFLAREAEIQHQSPAYRWRTNETERHTLGQLLRTMLGVDEVNFLRLRVVAREFWETSVEEEMENYDLADVLTRREDDGTALFVCESATLIIEMTTTARQREEYVVYLHAEDEAEGTLYMRVTLVQPTLSASPRHSLVSAEAAKTTPLSFLMALDTTDPRQRLSEFQYIWDDVQAALKEGKPLEGDRLFVSLSEWPNVGYDLYWGRRFFESRRYYEALQYFENAYIVLSRNYHEMSKSSKEKFYELAYYIGLCYSHLKLYRQAYFYLDATYSQHSIRYTTAYVNTLVDSCDFRALPIINVLLNNLSEELESDSEEEDRDNLPQNLFDFLRFLRRRKAYALIDLHHYDEAEQLLHSLLGNPDDEAFVLDELAYLEQQRAAEKDNDAQPQP